MARNKNGSEKKKKKAQNAAQEIEVKRRKQNMEQQQQQADAASWHDFRRVLHQLFQKEIEALRNELKNGQAWPAAKTIARGNLIFMSIKRAWCESVGRPIDEHSVGSVLPGKLAALIPKLIVAGADSMSLNPLMVAEEKLLKELEHGLLRLQGQRPSSDESPPRKLSDVPRDERVCGVVVRVIQFPEKSARGQTRKAFGKMIIEVQLDKRGPAYSVEAICRHKENAFEQGMHVRLRIAWKWNSEYEEWIAVAEDVYKVVQRDWS